MIYTSSINSKGQVVIPKDIREYLNIKPNSQIIFIIENDTVILKVAKSVDEAFGMIKTKQKGFTNKDYKEAIVNAVVEKYQRKNQYSTLVKLSIFLEIVATFTPNNIT